VDGRPRSDERVVLDEAGRLVGRGERDLRRRHEALVRMLSEPAEETLQP
jgi:hypothetical protein